MLQRNWWKGLCATLLMYSVIAGFLVHPPVLPTGNLFQSIRNIFYHVPMWITMMMMFLTSVYYSVLYLRGFNPEHDMKAAEFAKVGIVFSVLGMITGIEWSNATWSVTSGKPVLWTDDPKQICAAICMLIYFAYLVLRSGIKDDEKRGRIAAVYNIFACAMMFPLLFIIPRMADSSLHPGGSKGNPGLNPKDAAPAIRAVLYPAFAGWIMLGYWLANLKIRMRRIAIRIDDGAFTNNKISS